MRFLLILAIFLTPATAWSADIFFIQPAEMSPTLEQNAGEPARISADGTSWILRVESILAESGIQSVQIAENEPIQRTLQASSQWKKLAATTYDARQTAALAQLLKSTDINTLVVAEADFLIDLFRTLASDATEISLRNRQLIHLLRFHQGKVVDTLHLNAAGGTSLEGEENGP
jgi:hypothetical protein